MLLVLRRLSVPFHPALLDRTFALAREALERGERPISALLARDATVAAEAGDAVLRAATRRPTPSAS